MQPHDQTPLPSIWDIQESSLGIHVSVDLPGKLALAASETIIRSFFASSLGSEVRIPTTRSDKCIRASQGAEPDLAMAPSPCRITSGPAISQLAGGTDLLLRVQEVVDDPSGSKMLLVMDYMEGGPVMTREALERGRCIPESLACQYFRDMCKVPPLPPTAALGSSFRGLDS